MTYKVINEFHEIPYINHQQLFSRAIPTLTFYQNEQWETYHRIDDNKFMRPRSVMDVNIGKYFCESNVREDDVLIGFIQDIGLLALFPEIIKPYTLIYNDFLDLTHLLSVIDHFYDYGKSQSDLKREYGLIVSLQIKHICILCIKILDHMQEIMSKLWSKTQFVSNNLTNEESDEFKRLLESGRDVSKYIINNNSKLPSKFGQMIYSKNRVKVFHQKGYLEDKYKLPSPIADIYYGNQNFFKILDEYRNEVTHDFSNTFNIYATERGFAVSSDCKPFCNFNVWNQEHQLQNNLCSLKPVIGYIINQTLIEICNELSFNYFSSFIVPPPVVIDKNLWIRNPHNMNYISYNKALKKCLWWDE